jgi:pimeloyl-ACP methyl ester carboxylesterase
MRDDLRQFADALGLDRFVLGGHSMGGTVATLFAERYPDRLAGLILVDSPPPLVPEATLVTIEGAGHAAHRTRPDEFLATVVPFLPRIRTDGTSPVCRIRRVPRG